LNTVYFYSTLCDTVCQCLVTGRWFSLDIPGSSTNKTNRRDITGIVLIVALNIIIQSKKYLKVISRSIMLKFSWTNANSFEGFHHNIHIIKNVFVKKLTSYKFWYERDKLLNNYSMFQLKKKRRLRLNR
jgi:hypothetical protein